MTEIQINEKLKRIQLEILNEFHNFCIANDIKYSLSGGTLLGAIRHKGYIPWDDDIDVMMTREEYNRFLNIYNSKNFFLENINKDQDYRLPFSKLMKKNTEYVEVGTENQNYEKCIFIDIFPIDCISNKWYLYCKTFILSTILWILYRKNEFSKKNILIGKIINIVFKNRVFWIKKFTKEIENIKGDYYAELNYGGRYIAKFCSKSEFENYILTPFEGEQYLIIKNFDCYLKRYYNDYMKLPPLEMRKGGHEYSKISFGDCDE